MKKLRNSLYRALIATAVATSAWGANLLVNPGFETGDLSGWTVSGTTGVGMSGDGISGTTFGATIAVKEGTYAAYGVVRGFCCTLPEPAIFSQLISVTPGADYTVGFFAKHQSLSGVGYSIGDPDNSIQIFVDGVGLLPSSSHTSCLLDCFSAARGFLAFESTFNSGAASSVLVEFRMIASGTGYAGISMDDFYVINPVPEPASIGMVVVALGAFVWKRGRRS